MKLHNILMQHTEKNIRIIRDKLSRIGIGEKNLNDEMILASYSINNVGQLCAIPKEIPPAPIIQIYFYLLTL
jgi:hypothetical protein